MTAPPCDRHPPQATDPDPLTGLALAQALWEHGLVPATVHQRLFVTGKSALRFYPEGIEFSVSWQPWQRIAHCWYLLEHCTLAVHPLYAQGAPTGAWWCGEEAAFGAMAPTFADLPTAICQAALLSCQWRNYEPHGPQ